MAAVNVKRDVTDQFYRYKMPLIIAKVEGKGNGIKTVVVNMVDVAKALCRPPSYTCKYFGCELGAQTQMANGRYIVNGAHEAAKLQELLDGFIKRFVLCPECENPETDLHVQASKGRIGQTCKACGYRGLVDMRHKLTTFILKNPVGPGADEASGKKDKNGRKLKAGKKKNDTKDSPHSPNHDQLPSPDDEFKFIGENGTVADDGWSLDTSEAAVKQRMENLSSQATNLALTSDLEKSTSERVNMFFKFIEDIKQQEGVSALLQQIQKLKGEAERLDVMEKAAGVLAELLFDENILQQIKEYRPLLLVFVNGSRKAQKYLLGVCEMLVGEVHPQLLPKVPHILKALYDEDIVEEEAVLEWADKVPKKKKELAKQIREKAEPVIMWLRTAEEESSEDDEDLEVEYSKTATGDSIIVAEKESTVSDRQEEAVDIDIDAI